MARRLHRISDEQWLRLAASRRAQDRAGTPPRAAIGAIEIQLHSLDRSRAVDDPADQRGADHREAAAG